MKLAEPTFKTLFLEEAYMRTWLQNAWSHCSSGNLNQFLKFVAGGAALLLFAAAASAQEPGGEANLKLPDLSSVKFLGGTNGHPLLLWGVLHCIFGLPCGLTSFSL